MGKRRHGRVGYGRGRTQGAGRRGRSARYKRRGGRARWKLWGGGCLSRWLMDSRVIRHVGRMLGGRHGRQQKRGRHLQHGKNDQQDQRLVQGCTLSKFLDYVMGQSVLKHETTSCIVAGGAPESGCGCNIDICKYKHIGGNLGGQHGRNTLVIFMC